MLAVMAMYYLDSRKNAAWIAFTASLARSARIRQDRLIARILFLEGMPIVSKMSPIHIGSDVPKMFQYDHEAETGAIAAYNEAIILAGEVKDYATREILENILNDEDAHIDAIEENQDQIGHMTVGIYLTTKVD